MIKYINKFGLIFAAALFSGFFIAHILLGDSPDNYAKSETVGYGIMIFSAFSVMLAIREYRLKQGYLYFSQGIQIGAGVSAIGGLGFALYNWIYLTWINPDFVMEYVEYHRQIILSSTETQTVKDKQLADLSAYSELVSQQWFNLSLMFITVFIIGLLFTLLSAAMFRTKPHVKEETL